jgi:hypothetical protein
MVPPAEYEQAHLAALNPRCSPYESGTKPGTLHLVSNQGTLAIGRTLQQCRLASLRPQA